MPKYITFDTAAIIQLLFKNNSTFLLENIRNKCDEIWEKYIKTNKREFRRHNYKFHHMIKTDGVGCSVVLIKAKDGKPIHITRKMQANTATKLKAVDKYIEDILPCDRNKRVVTIDPNMGDLIYCVGKEKIVKQKLIKGNKYTHSQREGEKEIIFRYTQQQRKKEIGTVKYTKILEEITKTIRLKIKQ